MKAGSSDEYEFDFRGADNAQTAYKIIMNELLQGESCSSVCAFLAIFVSSCPGRSLAGESHFTWIRMWGGTKKLLKQSR